MDIAGDMAFGQSMSSEAVSWQQARSGLYRDDDFAKDLATLQEAAMAMTPDNVMSGRAADELPMVSTRMTSADGGRLLTTMKLAADTTYDGPWTKCTPSGRPRRPQPRQQRAQVFGSQPAKIV